MVTNNFVGTMTISKEIKIILNRLFLVFIIIGLFFNYLFFNKKVSWYNEKPDWKNPIVLPFHKVNTFWFWMIGIVINGIVYLFFIVQKDVEYIQSLLLFCLFFSLINAIFEEVIWRGIMLSALKEFTSTGYAIIVTSVGFGLLHLAIGFSISLSLLISVAGVIYALITLKTNSIYPSIVLHIVINIGMVYSGFII
ncbi:type II CAAX endopeptidase family protein [Bacillus sp. JJ634]